MFKYKILWVSFQFEIDQIFITVMNEFSCKALATSISKKSSHSSPQQSSTSSSPVTSKLIYPSQQHQIRKSDSSKNS
jgi:hypothetical protein